MIIKTIRDGVVLDGTWDRQLRDHQLISTSPEMLEALIDTLLMFEAIGMMKPEQAHEIARKMVKYEHLIEKATGKTWEEIKELLNEKL